MAHHNNFLYVAGGHNEEDYFQDFYRFDLQRLEWENVGTSKIYEVASYSGMTSYNNALYLFFGRNIPKVKDNSTVYRVDLTSSFD